ncbi:MULTISPECIES: response regulator [Achromobacter]|jgi:two-component system response regulator ParR|uniref:Response regulator n=3 Tax=Achromobacter TaxID=222 RepID=A0AAD2IZQ7_ACHAE|nr:MULTISPECIES: response regulator [Achromobacter]MBC9902595.1 response regulator [Achromobacter xylosoxidans]MBD0868430.1 response regulator [Achromobacter xylosoxidans]MBD9380350.1 response regulator [Achromobacter sp. ACM02]MBD9418723.1 response regulator [Achromobacter sp. ACM04]MBD9429110.1 response regulator [Achromobacter sp. ACM03]
MTKALLVEDDPKLSRLIAQFLEQHGFHVAQAYRGDHAVEAFRRHDPAITILDLMLPGRDGLQVCRDLRAFSSAPILMLTAREDDLDQILGLESGADDYVIKPVEPRVLLARVRALLRRHSQLDEPPERLEFGPLVIDRRTRAVVHAGSEVDLTTMEFEMLWALASQAGQVLTRDDLLNAVRGIEFNGLDRSVDVCVSKLRRKLDDDPRDPARIKTVWGKGYLFSPKAHEGGDA